MQAVALITFYMAIYCGTIKPEVHDRWVLTPKNYGFIAMIRFSANGLDLSAGYTGPHNRLA